MTVELLFGAFWYGLGVLMWWWPAVMFRGFSNEDVTPGARAFAVVAIFIGAFFFTISIPGLGSRFAFPGTVLTVGVLLLLKPIRVPGTNPKGPITPKIVGIASVLGGGLLAVKALV